VWKSHIFRIKDTFAESYHPELDETELLPPPDISKFKSLIGSGSG
jgi:hypothetical protein